MVYGQGQTCRAVLIKLVRAGSPFTSVTYQILIGALAYNIDKHCPPAHARPPLLFPGFSCLQSEFILSIMEFNTVDFSMFYGLDLPSDVSSPFITAVPKVSRAYGVTGATVRIHICFVANVYTVPEAVSTKSLYFPKKAPVLPVQAFCSFQSSAGPFLGLPCRVTLERRRLLQVNIPAGASKQY